MNIRSNILYFLLGLPIIIILYELFLVFALNNRNIMFLFLGQVALVPLLCFLILFLNNFLNNMYGTIVWFLLTGFFIYSSYFIINNYKFYTSFPVKA